MKIQDDWKFSDAISGLVLEVIAGDKLNRLRMTISNELIRDFWFDKKGKFDGTGAFSTDTSSVEDA